MARPLKQGLDYFPLDCQLDDKFELIEAEFGITGFGVVVKLLQKIYGQNGYYIEWTDEVALLFAKRIGLGGSVVSEIVKASVRRGIFDKKLFEKYHVLTSAGIQKRYLEAVSRRKSFKIKNEYLLVSCAQNSDNVSNNGVNVNNNSENAGNNTQRKVKESKVKKSKGEESKGNPGTENPASKALTPPQKKKLEKEFGKAAVKDYIERTSKYHCCNYGTIRQWILEDRQKKHRSSNQFNNFDQRDCTGKEMDNLEQALLRKTERESKT